MWVAVQRSILLMPNWYSVMENNYDNAPEFWGRDLKSVLENMNYWDCEYVIYYHDKVNSLNPSILKNFKILSKIEWSKHIQELGGSFAWPEKYEDPTFLLLKKKTS